MVFVLWTTKWLKFGVALRTKPEFEVKFKVYT